jgi:hypothetical protein
MCGLEGRVVRVREKGRRGEGWRRMEEEIERGRVRIMVGFEDYG